MAAKPTPYQHAYRKSAQYAPINFGANTPMNASPTSPRSSIMSQPPTHQPNGPHLRPLKTPLYIPAALRRTENTRPSPPKCDTPVDSWNPQSPFGAGPGDAGPLARIATEDLNSIYNDGPLSPISGPITRNHWQVRTIFQFSPLPSLLFLRFFAFCRFSFLSCTTFSTVPLSFLPASLSRAFSSSLHCYVLAPAWVALAPHWHWSLVGVLAVRAQRSTSTNLASDACDPHQSLASLLDNEALGVGVFV